MTASTDGTQILWILKQPLIPPMWNYMIRNRRKLLALLTRRGTFWTTGTLADVFRGGQALLAAAPVSGVVPTLGGVPPAFVRTPTEYLCGVWHG